VNARLFLIPSLLGPAAVEAVLPAGTIEVVRALDEFVVETPKVARAFLRACAHPRPIAELRLAVLDEHTPIGAVEALLAPVLAGRDLGLISDAGCPGVADPGAALVALAHRHRVRVVPLVGPSAILLGLMASGMNGQAFTFHGYLPAKPDAREAALRRLERDAGATGHTQLFIETPYRNAAMIASALRVLQPRTLLCAAAELGTGNSEVVRRPVADWRPDDGARLERRPALFLLAAE
jgi:16S rRNA (cytidine1402-2'-O)-methyltransferase